jgi:hypothetical protein
VPEVRVGAQIEPQHLDYRGYGYVYATVGTRLDELELALPAIEQRLARRRC